MDVLELASLGVVICMLFVIWLLTKQLSIKAYSVVYVFVGFYLVTIILGYLIYSYSDFASGVLFNIGSLVSKDEMQSTLLASLSLLFVFCFGAAFNVYILRPTHQLVIRSGYRHSSSYYSYSSNIRKKYEKIKQFGKSRWLFIPASLPLILLIIGIGPENLISRSDYLAVSQHELAVAGKALVMVALVLLGSLYANSKNWLGKWFCLFLFLIYELIFFSLASRRFAVAPIMFMLGVFFNRQNSKKVLRLFIFSIVLSLFLMQIPILLRGLSIFGLLPFFEILIEGTLLEQQTSDMPVLFSILTIIFAMPVTAYTMHVDPIDMSYLLTSISPLPGFLTDWPHIQHSLRLNYYVPYTAFGELLNYGVIISWSYFFVVGVYVSSLDFKIRAALAKGRMLYVVVMFGLLMIFILTLWQYNLRSATRILYYLLFSQMLFWGYHRVKSVVV